MVTGAFAGHLFQPLPVRLPLQQGLDSRIQLRIPWQELPKIPALPGQLVAEAVLLKPPLGPDSAGCSLGGQRQSLPGWPSLPFWKFCSVLSCSFPAASQSI